MTATTTNFFEQWIEVFPQQWKRIRDCSDADLEAAQELAKTRENPLRQFQVQIAATTRPV